MHTGGDTFVPSLPSRCLYVIPSLDNTASLLEFAFLGCKSQCSEALTSLALGLSHLGEVGERVHPPSDLWRCPLDLGGLCSPMRAGP